ncbi:MAG: hypothetical protein U0Q15_17515 [Kineosporiaceae bacterium]
MSFAPRVPSPRPASPLPFASGGLDAPFATPVLAPPTLEPTPRARRGRGRAGVDPVPLGSLTQREHRPDGDCRECGSHHVTRLSLCLTDGTPVEFTSCHRCEHRTWEHAGIELSVDAVLNRSRKA